MTTRRNFLKQSTLTAGILASTTQYVLSDEQKHESSRTVTRPACQIPVIYDVDIAIVGGGCAAVAAAVSATQKKAKVFLMSEESYLGEDLCGTMRFKEAWTQAPADFFKPLLKKSSKPTPLEYKSYLDDQMLDHEIPFLLTSHPSRVLFDKVGRVAGLVLVNRSGEQIIKCKSIIDATPDGSALKLAGLKMKKRNGESYVEYTVMGNDKRPSENLIHETEITFNNKPYLYSTYRFDGLSVSNKKEKAIADSMVKSKTWFSGMADSADRLFYLPNYEIPVVGQAGLDRAKISEHEDIFALNGFGIQNREYLIKALEPNVLTDFGSKLGADVAPLAKSRNIGQLLNHDIQTSKEVAFSKYSIIRDQLEVLPTPSENLPILESVDVVIVGGGTSGAACGVGAAESGASTLVIEPLHGLGGIGTVGKISVYYHGYEGGFNKRVDVGVRDMGADDPRSKKINYKKTWINTWKMEWYRKEIEKFGGEIWFGTTACGALIQDKTLRGVVVGTSFGKGIVLAKRVIDATGSSDIAIAAGAEYTYTDQEHAAIQGSGVPGLNLKKEYYNTDWTFIAEYDAFDTTRALTLAKKQLDAGNFDLGKMVQTRERRRIVGDYTIQAMDVIHNRTYVDAISYHKSNFDTHGYTVDPFFQLKPPHKKSLEAAVPLRSLTPIGFHNIVVTGLGFSAHRDTMPVLRMQRCLQNQGHALGVLAAETVKQNKNFREINLRPLQAKLKKLGTLPSRLRCAESKEVSESALNKAVAGLNMKLDGLETLLLNTAISFQKLKACLKVSENKEQRQAAAFILGMYGHSEGQKELMELVSTHTKWDKGWNYRGMGQFGTSSSPLDNLIIALGRSGDEEIFPVLRPLVDQLTEKSEFSHYRAIAIACESIKSEKAIELLSSMVERLGPTHVTRNMKEAKEKMIPGRTDNATRNNSLRELVTSRALYRCGDKNKLGEQRLKMYTKDLRGHFALHAQSVLMENQS